MKQIQIFLIVVLFLLLNLINISAESLTLNQVIKTAIANNPNLNSQYLDINAAELTIKEKYQVYDTNLNFGIYNNTTASANNYLNTNLSLSQKLTTGGTLSLNQSLSNSSTPGSNQFSQNLNLGLSQPLWPGFGNDITDYPIRLASLNYNTAYLDYNSKLNIFILLVISAYYDYFLAIKSAEIAKKKTAVTKYILDATKKKRDLLLMTDNDVLDANIDYKKALNDEKASQYTIDNSFRELMILTGFTPSKNIYLEVEDPTVITINESEKLIFSKNIDFTKLQIQKQSNDLSLKYYQKQTSLSTYLDASAGYSKSGSNFSNLFSYNQPNYQIGIRFQYLFENRANSANLDKQGVITKQLDLQQANLKLTLENSWQACLLSAKNLADQVATSKEIVDMAEILLKNQIKKFDLGLIDILTVRDAENSLASSALSYNQQKVDYLKKYYDLKVFNNELKNIFELE